MDEDRLRKTLQEESLSTPSDQPEGCPNAQALKDMLMREAIEVQADFRHSTNTGQRNRLQRRYAAIDADLGRLKNIDKLPPEEQLELRQRIYLDFQQRGRIVRTSFDARQKELESVEKGRRRVVDRGRAGAFENTYNRIKSELNYLLKNYNPSYDGRIETLIDQWRTSGDPSYDPSIKLKLRQARRKKSSLDYPI